MQAINLSGNLGTQALLITGLLTTLAIESCVDAASQWGFSVANTLPMGSSGTEMAVGDFNNDGILDIIAVDVAGYVYVWLGKGDGSFGRAIKTHVGNLPSCLVLGDFNADGNLDAAVGNADTGECLAFVAVLLGNGNGTFRTPAQYAPGTGVVSLAVGDMNLDGKCDLVVGGGCLVMCGRGNGTFLPPNDIEYWSQALAIGVADFNGDGKPDCALYHAGMPGAPGTVDIFTGRGDGNLAYLDSYAVCQATFWGSMAVCDLNGDGHVDLAVSGNADETGGVSVLLGDGRGNFQQAVTYCAERSSTAEKAADIDCDGKLDLVVANGSGPGSGSLSVFLGNGDGSLQNAVSWGKDLNWAPEGLAVGDFNGDGSPDLAVLTLEEVWILLNTHETTPPILSIKRSGSAVSVCWPSSPAGFVLESTLDLAQSNWQACTESTKNSDGGWETIIPLDSPECYFRLRRP